MFKINRYKSAVFLSIAFVFCFSFNAQLYALKEAVGDGGSNAQAVHQLGQTGTGIKVGLLGSRNIYANHEAFFDKDANGLPTGNSHAFNYDVTGSGIVPFDHDTWMAGIIASRGGAAYPNDIGAAPGCDIHCVRAASDSNEIEIIGGLNKLINDLNCQVITTAFAYGGTPNGDGIVTRIYDYYAFTYNNVVFAHPAGNNGIAGIQIAGDAFNGITTGGLIETEIGIYGRVGTVSGKGPTLDFRRKPDIAAPSNAQRIPNSGTNIWTIPPYNGGETSLSVPHTTGVAALLVGLANQTSDPDDNRNEVIRAVIINSAFPNIKDRYGISTNPADSNNTWHPDRGYGRIDALKASQLLNSPRVYKNTAINQFKGWAFADIITRNQIDNYSITGFKNHRLLLTVTWNRKINGSAWGYTEDTPRFNLNLTVRQSGGTVLFQETDLNNNLEKIDLLLPSDDILTIALTNPGIILDEARGYGLAFELIPPVTADLNLDYTVDINDVNLVKKNWLLNSPEIDEQLFEDGIINLKDFAVLADNWEQYNPAYRSL